jgi:hypothetical protein
MADLRKAKMQMQSSGKKITSYSRLYDASVAYFNWKKTLKNFKCSQYNTNAETRFKAIQVLIQQG